MVTQKRRCGFISATLYSYTHTPIINNKRNGEVAGKNAACAGILVQEYSNPPIILQKIPAKAQYCEWFNKAAPFVTFLIPQSLEAVKLN
jgi:hypothetical protein